MAADVLGKDRLPAIDALVRLLKQQGRARRQHIVSTWPVTSRHMVSTRSAHGQHTVSTRPAHGQHTVSTRSACCRRQNMVRTWPAHGPHPASTWSARGQGGVPVPSRPARACASWPLPYAPSLDPTPIISHEWISFTALN